MIWGGDDYSIIDLSMYSIAKEEFSQSILFNSGNSKYYNNSNKIDVSNSYSALDKIDLYK
jgi:hypothetical protein